MFLGPLLSSLLIQGVFSTILFPLLFSTHSRLLLYLLVSSNLLFSSLSRLLLYRLVSSSLLYSFKVSSLPSCSLFSSLLIKAFSLSSCVVFSSLLIQGFFLSFLSPLLLSFKVSSLPSCSPFSSLLYSFKVSSLPSCSLFSLLLIKAFFLYRLVSSSLLYSFKASSLPSCSPFSSLLYSFKASSLTSCPPSLFYSFKATSLPSCSSSLLLSFKVSSLPSCSNQLTCISFLFVASRSCFIFFFSGLTIGYSGRQLYILFSPYPYLYFISVLYIFSLVFVWFGILGGKLSSILSKARVKFLGVKVTRYVAQYPTHHETYASAKIYVATLHG